MSIQWQDPDLDSIVARQLGNGHISASFTCRVIALDPRVEQVMAKLADAMDFVQQRWQDADALDRWSDDGGRA